MICVECSARLLRVSIEANSEAISVIVPTIGRPASLRRLLMSLVNQTKAVSEVVIADASTTDETAQIVNDPEWARLGLRITRIVVTPPNAVRQRQAAIRESTGSLLLLLDDDVELEPLCVASMTDCLAHDATVVAAFADICNQSWPMPTRAWHFYLRHVLRMKEGSWQGRVVGPLLRFGYDPVPNTSVPIEWMGAGNTMVRRCAYERAGGFSSFFLHRCTTNEDVDLGLKLSQVGKIMFCPDARLSHFHAPSGRVSTRVGAEDDFHNRYLIMRKTQGRSAVDALRQMIVYFAVETLSRLVGSIIRRQFRGDGAMFLGRTRAMIRIVCGRAVR